MGCCKALQLSRNKKVDAKCMNLFFTIVTCSSTTATYSELVETLGVELVRQRSQYRRQREEADLR